MDAISGRSLAAVLLNPPSQSSGNRTVGAVHSASRVLGFQTVEIVNLCFLPSRSVVDLAATVADSDWVRARPGLERALCESDGLLLAWGVSGWAGSPRLGLASQINWFLTTAQAHGHRSCWMVGGQPRHPSRWHQYVSDKHGRTPGGSPENRLRYVLESCDLEAFADRQLT